MGLVRQIGGVVGMGRRALGLGGGRPPPVPRAPEAASSAPEPQKPRLPDWFDPHFYLAVNGDVSALELDPFDHYLAHGHREGRAPNGVVSRIGAKVRPPMNLSDAETERQVAMVHSSGVFDTVWYSERFGVPPEQAVRHFVTIGAFMGCDPNPFFSCLDYFEMNRDAAAEGWNPLVHYIQHGHAEGRRIGRRNGLDGRLTAQAWQYGF